MRNNKSVVAILCMLGGCGGSDDSAHTNQLTITAADGTHTVDLTELQLLGDATQRFWNFFGRGTTVGGVTGSVQISLTFDVDMTLRARDYVCGLAPYTMDVNVDDRGTPYRTGTTVGFGTCELIVNNLAATGEVMSVSFTAMPGDGTKFVTVSAVLEAPRSTP